MKDTGVDPRFQGCPGVVKLPLVLSSGFGTYICFVLSGCCLLTMPAVDVVGDGDGRVLLSGFDFFWCFWAFALLSSSMSVSVYSAIRPVSVT